MHFSGTFILMLLILIYNFFKFHISRVLQVLESIIRGHILWHFRFNNLFSKNQYGFILKFGQLFYNFYLCWTTGPRT